MENYLVTLKSQIEDARDYLECAIEINDAEEIAFYRGQVDKLTACYEYFRKISVN